MLLPFARHVKQETDIKEIVRLFEKIRASFPNLEMRFDQKPEQVELAMHIHQQYGLSFPVHVNLQGNELHLNAGAFWLEWFPCHEGFIRDVFFNAVTGLLSGKLRIVEHYRGAKVIKSELQEPEDEGWKTIGTWSCIHLPFPLRKTTKILQNTPLTGSSPQNPR